VGMVGGEEEVEGCSGHVVRGSSSRIDADPTRSSLHTAHLSSYFSVQPANEGFIQFPEG
jgi:hypothetical protein